MEDFIFDVFVFCMTIITGVILFEPYKWLFKKAKNCIKSPLLTIRILTILLTLPFVMTNYFIIINLIEYKKPELIIAILLGVAGSFFIFKNDDVIGK
mgnify:CR=1 FL=1